MRKLVRSVIEVAVTQLFIFIHQCDGFRLRQYMLFEQFVHASVLGEGDRLSTRYGQQLLAFELTQHIGLEDALIRFTDE